MFGKKDRDNPTPEGTTRGETRLPRGPEHDDFDAQVGSDNRPVASGSSPASPDDTRPIERRIDLADREREGAHYRADGVGPTDYAPATSTNPRHAAGRTTDSSYTEEISTYDGERTLTEQTTVTDVTPVGTATDVTPNGTATDVRPTGLLTDPSTGELRDHDDDRAVSALPDDERDKGGYRITRLGGWLLGILRILIGFQFLWAFVDKTFGLGYPTSGDDAWINGGRPTEGYLQSVVADDSNNPFKPMFQFFLDQPWVDWVFMIGLAGIGIALILGIAMWLTAICAAVLLVLMYLASWPIQQNPFVDGHLLEAVTVLALAACNAGAYIGLGRAWKTRRAHR